MNDSFWTYLHRLETTAFFSGYPLVYLAIYILGGNTFKTSLKKEISSFLPLAYALTGTLYLAFQARAMYPDYSLSNMGSWFSQSFFMVWALTTLLFWIPPVARIRHLSFLHSIVFFSPIVRDLYDRLVASQSDVYMLANDMKLYSISIGINLASLLAIILLYYLALRLRPSRTFP